MARRARPPVRRSAGSSTPATLGRESPKAAVAPAPGRRARWAIALLLVVAVALIYVQTVRHDFVNLDDEIYVTENPHLFRGLAAKEILWSFSGVRCSSWHPLTWISLMLDSQCYGIAWPGGFHLTNLLLHAASSVLLFLLLRRMTGQIWPAALVSALFAVHPARVESVAWVTERKDVLSGLFGMLALWAYVGYARSPGVARYLLVALALTLGLMAKSMLVTWPFVFLLLDYWPLERPFGWRLLLEKVPLLLLAAGVALVAFLMQRAGGAVTSLESVSIASRIARAAVVYLNYVRISLWPVDLSIYSVPEISGYGLPIAAGSVLALLTAGAVWAARRGQRWLAVGWFWFLGTLAPTIGLIQVGTQVMADRFLYLPQIGLWIAVVWAAAAWATSRRIDIPEPSNGRIRGLVAITASVLAFFTVAAWRQTACWQNSETLWSHALACDQRNALAHSCLGLALQAKNQNDLAEEHFREAIRVDPGHSMAYNNLGRLLEEKGRPDEAIECYRQALAHDGKLAEAENNLGNALRKKGDLAAAAGHLNRAMTLRDAYAEADVNLALLRQQQGDPDEAARLCRVALEINPRLAEAHLLLGNLSSGRGNLADAAEHLRAAMKINPRMPEAYFSLASTLLRLGQHGAALPLLRLGLTLQPGDVRALEMTARLLATDPDPGLRNGREAVELAVRAVQLNHGRDAAILGALAAAYAEDGQFDNAVRAAEVAHDLAVRAGRAELAAELQRHIDLFRAGMAFHGGKW